jgi:hypothetical protein
MRSAFLTAWVVEARMGYVWPLCANLHKVVSG